MKFEKGQQVSRADRHVSNIPAGTIGTVTQLLPGDQMMVQWHGSTWPQQYPFDSTCIEPLEPAAPVAVDPAAKPELAPWQTQFTRNDEAMMSALIRQQQMAHARGNQQAQMQGFGAWEPIDVAELRVQLKAVTSVRDSLRSENGDLRGERDSLRTRVQRLEASLDLAHARLAKRGGR